jgi:hypothetical protein
LARKKQHKSSLGISLNRKPPRRQSPFSSIFRGFEKVEAVRGIFGENTERMLQTVTIDLDKEEGFAYIDVKTGSIRLSESYLVTGDERHLYLDLIHELVHIRQLHEGKDLFDKRYSYVDRPTEVEAYEVCVGEARRIGMSDNEIIEYLKVDWVSEKQFQRLLKSLRVERNSKERS